MNPFATMMETPRSSPTTVKDTNREEDDALAPAWQEDSFHFGGVRSLLEPFNFEASTTTAKKKRTTCSCSSSCPVQFSSGEESPNPDDEVYHSDVAPKQDAKQYYFGLLSSPAATVGQPIDLNESAVSFASTTRSKPLKTLQPTNSNNEQDEENVYHYDVAPKQDEHQYYFGLGQTKTYSTTRYCFPPATKRVKLTTTTNNNTDEENLYHYDVAPKQDANQYYFGLASAAAAAAAGGAGGGVGQVHFEFDDNTAHNKALSPKSPSLLADAKSSLSTQDATCWSQ